VNVRGENGRLRLRLRRFIRMRLRPTEQPPGFVQLGQDFASSRTGDYLSLNYMGSFRNFLRPRVRRFVSALDRDLNHTIYLYATPSPPASRSDQHGPDSCAHVNDKCPEIHIRGI